MVMGAVERGGKVRLGVIPNRRKATIHAFLKANVSPDADAIHTDELHSYYGIGDENTVHGRVNHSAGEWVNGNIHTNTMEGVWSLLDRSHRRRLPQGFEEASSRLPA